MATRDPGPGAPSPLELPVYGRLTPALPPEAFAQQINARTRADDVVVDLVGRGGWVARTSLALGRRAISIEATALDRLLADVVVRPPDLRHLDAAFQAVSGAPHGTTTLRAWISDRFATRCPTCGRQVALDELAWEVPGAGAAARPVRRTFRCPACLDRRGRTSERRRAPVEPVDEARAAGSEPDAAAARADIRDRFPVPPGADPGLVEAVLDLHTPRQLGALAAILQKIEGELRASEVTSALRLAFLHAVLASSRLAAGGQRIRPPRIVDGALQPHRVSAWRERNPWVALEEGYRLVRGFVQALDEGPLGGVQARLVEPLIGVIDGPPMVALRVAGPGVLGRLAEEGAALESGHRARIRLALLQPPVTWTSTRLTEAYLLTAWTLGREAALLLPLGGLGRSPAALARLPSPSAALRAALDAAAPVLGRDGRAVVMLDDEGTDGILAVGLAGAAAGWRIGWARLAEPGERPGGLVELVPPGGTLAPAPRTRANRPLPPAPGGAGDPGVVAARAVFSGPEPIDGPYSPSSAMRVVADTAVAILKARGEPAPRERLLGDVLVGLDRSGQLRRFATSQDRQPAGDSPAGAGSPQARTPAAAHAPPARPPAGQPVRPVVDRPHDSVAHPALPTVPPGGPGPDDVAALREIVDGELARPDGRRLAEIEPGRVWLAAAGDEAEAATPLSDRVEWAAYSLLGPGGPGDEVGIRARLAEMFAGYDTPDPWLVDACLASYRAGDAAGRLAAVDELQARAVEHADTIALLADLGHRMGLAVTIAPREQSRRARGRPLADWVDGEERHATLAFLGQGGARVVEQVDCTWFARPKFAFLFEVEWTAMLGEPVLRRGRFIPADDRVVRFLVVVPERVDLVRAKLTRSPVLRRAVADGNWHVLRTDALRRFAALERPTLGELEPYVGLDPSISGAEQLAMFRG